MLNLLMLFGFIVPPLQLLLYFEVLHSISPQKDVSAKRFSAKSTSKPIALNATTSRVSNYTNAKSANHAGSIRASSAFVHKDVTDGRGIARLSRTTPIRNNRSSASHSSRPGVSSLRSREGHNIYDTLRAERDRASHGERPMARTQMIMADLAQPPLLRGASDPVSSSKQSSDFQHASSSKYKYDDKHNGCFNKTTNPSSSIVTYQPHRAAGASRSRYPTDRFNNPGAGNDSGLVNFRRNSDAFADILQKGGASRKEAFSSKKEAAVTRFKENKDVRKVESSRITAGRRFSQGNTAKASRGNSRDTSCHNHIFYRRDADRDKSGTSGSRTGAIIGHKTGAKDAKIEFVSDDEDVEYIDTSELKSISSPLGAGQGSNSNSPSSGSISSASDGRALVDYALSLGEEDVASDDQSSPLAESTEYSTSRKVIDKKTPAHYNVKTYEDPFAFKLDQRNNSSTTRRSSTTTSEIPDIKFKDAQRTVADARSEVRSRRRSSQAEADIGRAIDRFDKFGRGKAAVNSTTRHTIHSGDDRSSTREFEAGIDESNFFESRRKTFTNSQVSRSDISTISNVTDSKYVDRSFTNSI